MVKLKQHKNKILNFDLVIEGIKKDKLDFTFRIFAEGIEYGIPGEFIDDKVRVTIPPVDNFMKNRQGDIFEAKLEVTGDGKYYMKPWSDKIQIISEPKIEAKVTEIEDNEKLFEVKAQVSEEEEVIVEKKVNKKPEKKIIPEVSKSSLKKIFG